MNLPNMHINDFYDRRRGVMLGLFCGDSLGSMVEFRTAQEIEREYENGLQYIEASPVHKTIAGQLTDDSEMANALLHALDGLNGYDDHVVKSAYQAWLATEPFDYGMTVSAGLRGQPNIASQANGALMRVAPIAVYGDTTIDQPTRLDWAARDARITHPHPICQQVNQLYVFALFEAIHQGRFGKELYQLTLDKAAELSVDQRIIQVMQCAQEAPPRDFMSMMGWVLIAFQNLWYHVLHTDNSADAIRSTCEAGGDTDTNGAICGAMFGAMYGASSLPKQWIDTVLTCEPQGNVNHPRPREYWAAPAIKALEGRFSNMRLSNKE